MCIDAAVILTNWSSRKRCITLHFNIAGLDVVLAKYVRVDLTLRDSNYVWALSSAAPGNLTTVM